MKQRSTGLTFPLEKTTWPFSLSWNAKWFSLVLLLWTLWSKVSAVSWSLPPPRPLIDHRGGQFVIVLTAADGFLPVGSWYQTRSCWRTADQCLKGWCVVSVLCRTLTWIQLRLHTSVHLNAHRSTCSGKKLYFLWEKCKYSEFTSYLRRWKEGSVKLSSQMC